MSSKSTDPPTSTEPSRSTGPTAGTETSAGSHPADAPHPEDSRKPDTPADVTAPSWRYVLRTTMREYSADGCSDLAAGLTYRTVLSIFPALIALVSLLSLVGQSESTVTAVLDQAQGIVPPDMWQTVRPALESILTAPAAGIGLIIGLLTALWSASSYTKAFARAMNTIHDVPEGRGAIKLNLQMYLLTALFLLLGAVGLLIVVLSGPVAEAVGSAIGLGSVAITVWSIAKWVVLAAVVVFTIALLYYATPNVQQPKFRWVSMGALLAIIVAVLASVGFFLYVSNFGNYNATYGALAGVIVLLLWIYIINSILLFGAEVDSEIERGRELQAGIPAEEELQLPPRDTKASDKRARKYAEDVERGRNLRKSAGRSQENPSGGREGSSGRRGQEGSADRRGREGSADRRGREGSSGRRKRERNRS
ncbi:YhjD/YihY/BrkB family envelope integrity protein [Brachybacterium sp. GCM10030252]|uniref:YihY/virulence factor BrkB family protein n=1 Tax=Brachybacterium sp. GCM10030252 TaxID=3273380 RepID=UPI00360E8517